MQFLICPKHNKIQKAPHKLTTNSYVCMNRYCQDSFQTLCSFCKNQHRDHSNKILTLEDITFLIERLLKSPFKQLNKYIDETVSIMKKFKLIQQNKSKIQALQKEIYLQISALVQHTETLIHQYAICKKKITDFSDLLVNIETPQIFSEFKNKSTEFLSNLDYNFQKDKFEYGNQIIRQKFQNRRKLCEKTKRKFEELKDYSMKMIEVILANEDSDEEQEDLMYKKKMYQILKSQLQENTLKFLPKQKNNKTKQTENPHQQVISADITSQTVPTDLRKSKSTFTRSLVRKNQQASKISKGMQILSIEKSCQTSPQWITQIEEKVQDYELKTKKLEHAYAKSLNESQYKISILVKQRQSVKKDNNMLESKQKQKNEKILQIEMKLRQNKTKREQKNKEREKLLQKLIQISNWKTLLDGEKID